MSPLKMLILAAAVLTCSGAGTIPARPGGEVVLQLPEVDDDAQPAPVSPAVRAAFDEATGVAKIVCPRCADVPLIPLLKQKTGFPFRWAAVVIDPTRMFVNPKDAQLILDRFGYDALVGVMAHEYGHIISRTGSQMLSDAWAGCTMQMLGRRPDKFIKFIRWLIDSKDSAMWRDYATWAGWHRCRHLQSTIGKGDKKHQIHLLLKILKAGPRTAPLVSD